MTRELANVVPVNDFSAIHPALDFWDGKAVVSVGCKWMETWLLKNRNGDEEIDIKFTTNPFCIVSTGEQFRYTKQELATRHLFFSGKLELPEQSRWSYDDIHIYNEERRCKDFPELYKLIRNEFEYYIDYSDTRYYSLLACFTIYTYFYPLFFNAPVLQFWGEMRTGKTKALALLEAMVFNPVNSANISGASVFRLVESRRAIILFDESEDLMTADRSREIRNMLLAGTGKSGETYRQEKDTRDSYKTQSFRVFSPKVIANIAGIDMPALLSRMIRITTIATKDTAKENRCVELEDVRWQAIRDELYRVCLGRYQEVIAIRDNFPETKLTGRTLYIWQGMLTVARLVSMELFRELEELAEENKENIEAEIEDFSDEPEEMLASLIKLASDKQEYFSPDEVMVHFSRGFGITSKKDLATRLGKLGITRKYFRRDGKFGRYYWLNKEKLIRMERVVI